MAVKLIAQGFIAGIPARDLNDDDIEKYVVPLMEEYEIDGEPDIWLASTGLYEPIKKKGAAKEKELAPKTIPDPKEK